MNMSILRCVHNCVKKFTQPAVSYYFCTKVITQPIEISDTVISSESEDMSNNQNKNRIVWIDLEMTGLDVEKDRIMEVACLVTDENLHIVSEEFSTILYQPDSKLNAMNEWCTNMHSSTGLTEACRRSTEDEKSVDRNLLNFMMKYLPKGKCPMAGNSVYIDRLFLRKYLPLSNEYMHYRIIDVSSIKEVVKRWQPEIHKAAPKKKLNHRALDDIKESIQELDYYRNHVFNANPL
ncbi:oligoribonuclease [Phymastichus coffea]|uniref:oligoribonuclease n=1 Tax=Phymastichus coffea TaxID=108790 RepID=UPI00273B57EB|nr:oligoribonuclease [Phymastichus coffea]